MSPIAAIISARRAAPVQNEEDQPSRRVLLLAPYTPRGGGIGRMMAYLADHAPWDAAFVMLESRGGGAAWQSCWHMAKAAWVIIRASRGNAGTILHVNMAEGGSVFRKGALLLLGRRLGLSCVLHLHAANITAFYECLPWAARVWVRHVFGSAHVCIVLGQPWRDWLMKRIGVPAARIEILPNGVPAPRVVAFPPAGQRCVLVFLGNLQPRKGLADLIAALADGALRHRNWELTVAGDGDQAPFLAQIEEAGLSDRVRLLGWIGRPEAVALLARASVLILPSYHEGLPLVLLEAASLGIPCVTTPVGAIPEIFTDGETALLVPPGDRQALGSAVARLIDDPPLRGHIGRNARALFDHALSIEIFARRLASIYTRHCV